MAVCTFMYVVCGVAVGGHVTTFVNRVYGPSFFHGRMPKRTNHKKVEKTRIHDLRYRPGKRSNKIFSIWLGETILIFSPYRELWTAKNNYENCPPKVAKLDDFGLIWNYFADIEFP